MPHIIAYTVGAADSCASLLNGSGQANVAAPKNCGHSPDRLRFPLYADWKGMRFVPRDSWEYYLYDFQQGKRA